MPIIGTPRKRHHRWKFVVEIAGIVSAGFQAAGPLEAESATVAISEGGSIIPHKSAGRATFAKVTLSRGATSDRDMYDWWLQTANAAANGGAVDEDLKRSFDIVQQDRDGTELRRWRIFNAFSTKFTAGDWDNESDEFVIEQVEIDYDYFDLIQ